MQLWRYSGTLMGVDTELVPTTESEARRLADLIAATQDEPDADSRLLTHALLNTSSRGATTAHERKRAARQARFSAGLCRALIGAVNGPTQAQLCAAYAKASLLLDPRVSAVDKAVATIVGDQMDLALEVIPIVGRPIQITASP